MVGHSRRSFLSLALSGGLSAVAFGAGLLPTLVGAVEKRAAFAADGVAAALEALGLNEHQASTKINLKLPEIAENGAAVPVEIESKLPNTRSISILVEKNPHAMSAEFNFPEGTEPFVATRVKVAESSLIHVVVKTDAGVFHTSKLVKVTLGGCGG
jgi:sulfur-oxidizing protein SoxY